MPTCTAQIGTKPRRSTSLCSNTPTTKEEMSNIILQMIGEMNASHTGFTVAPTPGTARELATRYPGFDLEPDSSGFYKVSYIYKDGPADHEYVKIHTGDFILAVDDHDIKSGDNYWKNFTVAPGRKFKLLVNSKPTKTGAWDVRIEPVNNGAFTTLQYERWVAERRAMVDKLSGGEIGYVHIRAMNEPSLRQFERELAENHDKKALIIDQRFNGGGGIDQELLGNPEPTHALPVHQESRRHGSGSSVAGVLRSNGRDGKRALSVRCRDVPARFQGFEAR